MEGLRKIRENPVRKMGVPAEIRNEYLSKTSHKRYCLSQTVL
jgi:hypothetical protein